MVIQDLMTKLDQATVMECVRRAENNPARLIRLLLDTYRRTVQTKRQGGRFDKNTN